VLVDTPGGSDYLAAGTVTLEGLATAATQLRAGRAP
jgi:hypothetical protein